MIYIIQFANKIKIEKINKNTIVYKNIKQIEYIGLLSYDLLQKIETYFLNKYY